MHEKTKIITFDWIENYRTDYHPEVTSDTNDDTIPVTPHPAQQEALVSLREARLDGKERGLVIMATGLGKTWLAAFDVFQQNVNKLLFVAHREEILSQAINTFSNIFPDKEFGKFDAKNKDIHADFIFSSVQTLSKIKNLREFPIQHFDYIIIDEFHHAAAKRYRNILNNFTPNFLLGLKKGMTEKQIHTSGHADKAALEKMIEVL